MVGGQLIAEADMHARDGAPGRVGLETIDIGASHERDILVAECRIDADDLRVGLAVGKAGKAIVSATADTGAVLRNMAFRILIQENRERLRKRVVAFAFQGVAQRLDTRLVADRRMGVGRTRPALCGVNAAQAMHVEQALGSGVIRLQFSIPDRPSRRYAVGVLDLLEVLWP